MRSDVLPGLTFDDVVDVRRRHFVPVGKDFDSICRCSNRKNIGLSEFVSATTLSNETATLSLVSHVVRVGSDVQMLRVHTQSVVTCVVDLLPFRHRTVGKFPRHDMGAQGSLVPHSTVPRFECAASPLNTPSLRANTEVGVEVELLGESHATRVQDCGRITVGHETAVVLDAHATSHLSVYKAARHRANSIHAYNSNRRIK